MMLDAIISSRTKRLILKQFLSSPDAKFYVRQLASVLKVSVGTIYRELIKLEDKGILKSERLGNLRLFSCNKKNPLFYELKKLIFKTEGIKGKIEQALEDIKGLEGALIYGSFAKGEEDAKSDIDLLFLGSFSEDEVIRHILSLEREFGREINYTTYTRKEFLKERGITGSFLNIVLRGKVIFLKGGPDVFGFTEKT